MKEIKAFTDKYFEEYDIHVKQYLTYAEIQAIVNSVKQFDSWAERNTNIDVLLIHYATDVTDKEIETVGHDRLLQSGLIDVVKNNIVNLQDVYTAISFEENPVRLLVRISKEMPEFKKKLDEVMLSASSKE